MARRGRRARLSEYTVYVTPGALREARGVPGHIRQRVRQAIDGLADNPRPPGSKALEISGVEAEVRRIRLDAWRIVYAVTEADHAIDVLAVRKRPPYDYGDLGSLIADIVPP
jgi:mRNA interferase RelE/StbE